MTEVPETAPAAVPEDVLEVPDHRPTAGNWAAVALMVGGFAICTVAFVWQLLPVGIVGAVIGAAGIVTGKVSRIMEHTH